MPGVLDRPGDAGIALRGGQTGKLGGTPGSVAAGDCAPESEGATAVEGSSGSPGCGAVIPTMPVAAGPASPNGSASPKAYTSPASVTSQYPRPVGVGTMPVTAVPRMARPVP